ncbi:MAG: hypothetical protein O3C34_01245 [Proteobacteria bacterium]|nr:hypothetical protein [Pseudomonadota bacterium]
MNTHGIKQVGYLDIAGGGQIRVDGNYAYVGHMEFPHGTSIVDVSDPKKPRIVAEIGMPTNTHSHKVRVQDGLMVVNHERLGGEQSADFSGGLGFYDVSDPNNPKHIGNWNTPGKGVHRFDFDGKYVYFSTSIEGYIGNIMLILDVSDPLNATEVGRWWIPGQWEAGGEEYLWEGQVGPRCHHPLRMGDRLYVSYWHHGFFILDISDISKPKHISGFATSPAFPHPEHTALPIPFPVQGRNVMILADEDVAKLRPHAPALAWVVDITIEQQPLPIATIQPEGQGKEIAPPMTGCHQPSEVVTGTEIPFAWFAQGLQIFDIADPYAPKHVAWFQPDPAPGIDRLSTNDVTIDDRGLIYIIDRIRGMHIVERV